MVGKAVLAMARSKVDMATPSSWATAAQLRRPGGRPSSEIRLDIGCSQVMQGEMDECREGMPGDDNAARGCQEEQHGRERCGNLVYAAIGRD